MGKKESRSQFMTLNHIIYGTVQLVFVGGMMNRPIVNDVKFHGIETKYR